MPESPTLLSVVYASVATVPFSGEQLAGLLTASREANRRADVTGLLLHRDGRFIQFLEGPERTVRALMARIAQDRRHVRVRTLLEDAVDRRQFSDWTMGFAADESDTEMPDGFRRSFDDLDGGDGDLMPQAARDLTAWFRARG
jgi:hypothetical protein